MLISGLHSLLLVTSSNPKEVMQVLSQCREYITGLRMETSRKELSPDTNLKRVLEMSAYFTHCALRPEHLLLSLRSAMALSYKAKNFGSASLFARRLLELNPAEQVAQQVYPY